MSDGWLDPNGKFWEASSHHEFASDWLADEDDFDPVGTLEKQGWLHISANIIYYRRDPTANQRDIIYDWFAQQASKLYISFISAGRPEWTKK